jgi:hypothetical protein
MKINSILVDDTKLNKKPDQSRRPPAAMRSVTNESVIVTKEDGVGLAMAAAKIGIFKINSGKGDQRYVPLSGLPVGPATVQVGKEKTKNSQLRCTQKQDGTICIPPRRDVTVALPEPIEDE